MGHVPCELKTNILGVLGNGVAFDGADIKSGAIVVGELFPDDDELELERERFRFNEEDIDFKL
jgi:hypothetical protein